MFCDRPIDWAATAAWAQAVLTFIGIIASGWIAAAVSQRPSLAQKHQRLSALAAIGDNARKTLVGAARFAESAAGTMGPHYFDVSLIDSAIFALDSVVLWEVSPGTLAADVIRTREYLVAAKTEMTRVVASGAKRKAPDLGNFWAGAVDQAADLCGKVTSEAMFAARAEMHWWLPRRT